MSRQVHIRERRSVYEVLGRQFRTQADYDAALKDAEKIEQLKTQYGTGDISGLRQLALELKSGKHRFRTILGRDFLDETEELLTKAEKEEKESAARGKKGSAKKGKKPVGSSGVRTAASKSTANKPAVKKKKLEDYDADMQKNIVRELKKRERIRKAIMAVCIGVAGSCFVYLSVYAYQTKRLDDYASIQQNLKGTQTDIVVVPETPVIHYDDQEIIVPDILDEYKLLYSLNKKLIGWVKIDDTYIDYPVLQTSSNDYYLNHNFDQEEDKNGSIFLDKDCSILPRTTNLILYGHHMNSGRMFGQLNKYSSEKFYEEHKYIQFDTIYEKGTYEVMFVFRSRIYNEDQVLFKYYQFINAESEVEFNSYMREMAEMSLYDTGVMAEYGDEILTLSTCDYYTDNGRFVVVAKRIK